MDTTELEELKALLLARKADLQERLKGTSATARPVSLDEPIGRLSRMDALQQQQMAGAARRQMEVQLQQVQSALLRLEHGDYGSCLRCEEAIAIGRLRVRPEASLCHRCQRGAE